MSAAPKKELVIFKAGRKSVKLRGDFCHETIWASLDEIAQVFERDKSVISRHLKNIFDDKELERAAVVAKNATTAADGKTYQVEYYNLDAIISVGYRVNSKVATSFRQWATTVLRQHITEGFTINRASIGEHYDTFMEAVATLKQLAPAQGTVDTESVLELVHLFADTWFSLDAFDKDALTPKKTSKKQVKITTDELLTSVTVLKGQLLKKGEASEQFAQERKRDSVESIVGNVMQSFAGKSLYPTVEAKAAHLLYFIVKNHPFVDGNKRVGAYSFVWFLRKAGLLDTERLTPSALTAITLLIAESDPKDKERMTSLVTLLLTQRGK